MYNKDEITQHIVKILNGLGDNITDEFYNHLDVEYTTGNTAIGTIRNEDGTKQQFIIHIKDVAK